MSREYGSDWRDELKTLGLRPPISSSSPAPLCVQANSRLSSEICREQVTSEDFERKSSGTDFAWASLPSLKVEQHSQRSIKQSRATRLIATSTDPGSERGGETNEMWWNRYGFFSPTQAHKHLLQISSSKPNRHHQSSSSSSPSFPSSLVVLERKEGIRDLACTSSMVQEWWHPITRQLDQ